MYRRKGSGGKRPVLKLVVNNYFPKSPKRPLPVRPKNADVRPASTCAPDEMERLIDAAKSVGRYQAGDSLLILLLWRHGLRVSEAIDLRWSNIDWDTAHLYVKRRKNGRHSNQPIDGRELRLLRALKRESNGQPWIFMSERGTPLNDDTVRKIVKRAGEVAEFDFPIHPHMLRHACGYALAAKGRDTRTIQDYLGHQNIQHTVRYTELAPGRLDGLWD